MDSLSATRIFFCYFCITKYEIYSGATPNQIAFWDNILQAIIIIALDEISVDTAVTMAIF